MKCVTLTIGHNVGSVPFLTSAHIVKRAADLLAVSGLTAYECKGYYMGQAEASTRIELDMLEDNEAARIVAAVPTLAADLMQECILVSVVESSANYVGACSITAAAA